MKRIGLHTGPFLATESLLGKKWASAKDHQMKAMQADQGATNRSKSSIVTRIAQHHQNHNILKE